MGAQDCTYRSHWLGAQGSKVWRGMTKILQVVMLCLGAVALLVGLSALMALPVMWLWNGIVPELFHGPTVSFWQAWGLSLLSSLLFKPTITQTKK